MPNHVLNEVIFEGDSDIIENMMWTVKKDDGPLGSIDFNKIIPQPDCLLDHMDDVNSVNQLRLLCGQPLEDIKTEDGLIVPITKLDWYTWRVINWGTKWNAYDEVDTGYTDRSVFKTAWSTPVPILRGISAMYPELSIYHNYAEENNYAGISLYQGGNTVYDIPFENLPTDTWIPFRDELWFKYDKPLLLLSFISEEEEQNDN